MSEIIPLSLAPGGLLNVYLLRGSKTILVDTGLKNNGSRILKKMAEHGVRLADISLILLTHGHTDHAGSVVELRKTIDAPVAISRLDAPLLESGINSLPPPITWMGSVLRLVLGKHPKFPAYRPDLLIDENFDTSPYGVSSRIVPVPGHTSGMIAILTESNEVIAGDTFAGKPLTPRQPSVMYLHDDRELAAASLRNLVALRPTRYFVGHGGPFEGDAVRRWVEAGGGE